MSWIIPNSAQPDLTQEKYNANLSFCSFSSRILFGSHEDDSQFGV